MNSDKKIILVTGGGGYIGSHIVKRLLQDGYKVVAFDNFSRGFREPLDVLAKYGMLEVIAGDLTEPADVTKVFQGRKIDAVMHLAALCLVDESVKMPEKYFENNVTGTLNLLNVMNQNKVKKIIFSSTCAVYGNAEYLPVNEKHPTRPTNPYGDSKLQAEELIKKFGMEHGLNYVILRYFNVCGADKNGEIGDSKKPSELLVQNAVRAALGIEEFKLTCPRVDTPDGTPIRDYIDVRDVVAAHLKAYAYLEAGMASDVFNLGNGQGWSVKEILAEVKQELHKEFKVIEGALRQGEYEAVYADTTKARSELGWYPVKNLQESIKSLAKWYSHKPHGYEK